MTEQEFLRSKIGEYNSTHPFLESDIDYEDIEKWLAEYATLKAEEAFNAARERVELPEGVKMPYKKIFKTPEKYPDYQTFKNQKP